jgi:hypothetical protein
MAYTQSDQNSAETPPVAQPLVSEGDFALKLLTALDLGTATTEVQAEDILISVGIAPKNGWIADYPMTPIIIGEVQSSVVAAAVANKLPIGEDEALRAFQGVATEFGLALVPGSGQYAESQPPTSSEYIQPSVVNNYYYEQGPPVVTYYPPPWDYYYLYAWVPYPFWFSGFFFPGFFILNDFNVIVVGHHHHHHFRITNHFIDPKTNKAFRVDPTTRRIGRAVNPSPSRTQGFNSTEARRGAASIFNQSRPKQTTTMNPTLRGPSRVQVPSNRDQSGPSMAPKGGTIGSGSRNPIEPRSFGAPGRSFTSPAPFGTSRSFSSPRSFSTPSFGGKGLSEGSRGGSFGGSHRGGFGGFRGGGGRRS